jgi:hypothetical protein
MARKKEDIAVKDAKHGEKMIEIKVRFWTDNIEGKEKIRPKHAWSSGVVRIARNKSHGIVPGRPRPFNSLMELGSAVEDVLLNHGITLHLSRKTERYMAEKPSSPSNT